jgi:uncharacterized protein YxjI
MHPVLNRNVFFVKEHVGFLKAANNFDILDPQSQQPLMECREENLGFFTKLLRFTDYKRNTPFDIQIRTPEGNPVVRVRRGISLFLSNVEVFDEQDQRVGSFQQKMFSLGGSFTVLGAGGEALCELKGKWTGWDFRFVHQGNDLARVSKKWAGLAKEMFTTADNYVLEITPQVPTDHPLRILILAAVMCIDLVLKE